MIFEKIRERLQKSKEDFYHNNHRNYYAYNQGLKTAINIVNQVEAEDNNGWIFCEVELPKVSTSYLVTEEVIINSKKLYVVDIRLFGTEDEWLCPSNRKIIAWQPLPKPPKGE